VEKILYSILLFSLAAAPAVFAQRPNGAGRQMKYLTTMLDLTPDEQTQLSAVFANAATSNQPLFTSLRAAQKQFDADKDANPGNLSADANAVSAAQSQLMVNNANTDNQVKTILTASQYAKYKALHGRGGDGGWGHGHGGPGRPGGPGGPGGPPPPPPSN
jgi:Spy/CpxP family protein refolding chaperone